MYSATVFDEQLNSPSSEREALVEIINGSRIIPYFQPLVDLHLAEVFGYELLSRAPAPFTKPTELFAAAERYGLLWDLERACRLAALERIAQLPEPYKGKRFFLNVSPHVFSDPRFRGGFTIAKLQQMGLDQRQLVIEITEAHQINDLGSFEELARHYVDQGFSIALDDFGAGHSSLVTLVTLSPHYLKLDRAIIEKIHRDSYKQQLVRSVLSFATSVDSKLLAEGVEEIEELEYLIRLGVRYAQGFFLGRPGPEPVCLSSAQQEQIKTLTRRYSYPHKGNSHHLPVVSLATRPPAFARGTMLCEDLDLLFRRTTADHVVLLAEERPLGLITKQHFYTMAGGPFGYTLIKNKCFSVAAKKNHLAVEEGIDLTVLGRLAMERDNGDLYDPVIMVDPAGNFTGTVTMKQLLTEAIKLEIQIAASANPLTDLPGNRLIQEWLQDVTLAGHYSVIYADLDQFKAYNDVYGFSRGDEMLKFTARLLEDHVREMGGDVRLGHIGGDDFIVVMDSRVDHDRLALICTDFDCRKEQFFQTGHLRHGYYQTVDRQGQSQDIPLVTISLAVINQENFDDCPNPAQFGEVVAGLKKKVKSNNALSRRSGFLINRRREACY
ncbi:MAG: GGDEF domain-containing protein [Desulfobulbaceae bacterium]|nr:GGDEF domain-containing protein [Desulfobulbaceae bacterium]